MTGANLRPGTPYHRYLPGPHRAAWNGAGALAAAAAADGALIVCEAILDGLTCWRHGLRHVTSAYGVNGFTEHHRRLIAHAAVKTVFLAYDNDAAGNAAAATLADELIAMGKSVYRVVFPERVKDANGLAMASEDPAAALRGVLDAAEFMGGSPRVSVAASPASLPTAPISDATTSATKEETTTPAAVPAYPTTVSDRWPDEVQQRTYAYYGTSTNPSAAAAARSCRSAQAKVTGSAQRSRYLMAAARCMESAPRR
jgi:DNA primase